MESIYERLGIKTVINASGKMTALGSSLLNNRVVEVLQEASQHYVNMDELIKVAGQFIAGSTGSEDGCPTNSASAGIVISVAALIAGTDLTQIEQIPFNDTGKNEIIIQQGHDIHFGASVRQMVQLGGGKPVIVGAANKVVPDHIRGAITEKTAGILYIKSHHAVQKGMVSLKEMIEIARESNIPLIMDAAAEQDLKKYISIGADAVIYSGSKAINGPTSGFISGKKSIIEACRAQYQGVGRAMKVSKESVIGLLASLEQYQNCPYGSSGKGEMEALCKELNTINGLHCRVIQDEAGRDIYRASIAVSNHSPYSATELLGKLEAGNPAIYLRNHYANTGVLFVDPRPLKPGHGELIVERFKEIFS